MLFAIAITARAAVADDTRALHARERFEAGMAHFNLDEFSEALTDFEAGYRLKPSPEFLFNIAQSYRKLNRPDKALEFYRKYLIAQPEAPNRVRVQQLIDELSRGRRPGALPPSAPPPKPRSTVTESPPAKPHPTVTESPPVKPHPTVTAAPPPSPAPSPAIVTQAEAPPKRGRTLRLAGIGVGAGGIALLALGGVFVGLAKNADNNFLHPANGIYSPGAESSRTTYQALDATFFVLGGVAVATGVTLFVLGQREERQKRVALGGRSLTVSF
jgi:tetratricopeptide (TPR) repeat protein